LYVGIYIMYTNDYSKKYLNCVYESKDNSLVIFAHVNLIFNVFTVRLTYYDSVQCVANWNGHFYNINRTMGSFHYFL